MRYEIDYVSRSGNTKKLVEAVDKLLPVQDTEVIDLLREEPTADADAYVIVFSFNMGNIPLKVMDLLDLLEGKTLLFLVALGAENPSDYQETLEQKLDPFLPSGCDNRGVFLCKGAFPDSVLDSAEERLALHPEDEQARIVSECCKQAMGHPDQADIDGAVAFVRSRLGL